MGIRALLRRRPQGAGLPPGRRIYAIGDIHGELNLFATLLGAIESDLGDRDRVPTSIVILGDFIDRGPDTRGLIDILSRQKQSDRFVVLLGNHEAALLDSLRGDYDALDLWIAHGGMATLKSYGVAESDIDPHDALGLLALVRKTIPHDVVRWLSGLPRSYRCGGYFFVHAGVRPGVALSMQSADDLLWIRDEFTNSTEDYGAVVVHGHTIDESGVAFRANRIGVDTGAYRTGVLSAVALEQNECWEVSTRRRELMNLGAQTSDRVIPIRRPRGDLRSDAA